MATNTQVEHEGANIGIEQPTFMTGMSQNQRKYQWVNNEAFYNLLNPAYRTFYYNWVRIWLQWYDGYVNGIHSGSNGLLSTNIGSAIVNRSADMIVGSNIMFKNSRKPKAYKTDDNGKQVAVAKDFISNKWANEVNFNGVIKSLVRDTLAGGFALLKVNKLNGKLWIDELRADRFYVDKLGNGEIRKSVSVLAFYDNIDDTGNAQTYGLIEERRYETIDELTEEEVPVIEYKIYNTTSQVQFLSVNKDSSIKWEQLPKPVRKAFKAQYGTCRLNEPQHMAGFKNLGVYLVKATESISNVPQIGLGESMLNSIMNMMFEYDFFFTAFNTELYISRGRVILPKYMQDATAQAGNDSLHKQMEDIFYSMYNTADPTKDKPEPIQFELRAEAFKNVRNIILEMISVNTGLSTSTLASFLQDGSQRTAREVSAEESNTTLFVDNRRATIEKPINDMLKDVLRFYGFIDDVEIRWTRAGMTNQTVLVETLAKAVQSGLMSLKKAHAQFNYDDDDEQLNEDYELVMQDKANERNSMFDNLNVGEFE